MRGDDGSGAGVAAFKVPAKVWIVHEELPRNASGKVLKTALRQQHGDGGAIA